MLKELEASLLGKVLSSEQLARLATEAESVSLKSGETLCRSEDVLDHFYIVLKGCLRAVVGPASARRTGGYINSGETLGAYCLLTGEPVLADLEAEFDSTLARIPQQKFQQLVENAPDFLATVRKSFHQRIAAVLRGKKHRRFARNVVFVVPDSGDCEIPLEVANRLARRGERVALVTNQPARSAALTHFPLDEKTAFTAKWQDTNQYDFDRIVFCLPESFARQLVDLMDQAHEILWCFEESKAQDMHDFVTRILEQSATNAHKIKRVCLLAENHTVAPVGIQDERLHRRDFIMPASETPQTKRMFTQGIDRITRHLCDIKIGLSLAGGGARGLVHFGILKALDRENISFDMMSGTSAGSMFGLSYATGADTDYLLGEYTTNLTPRFPFSVLRGKDRWFLLWKFRTRGWDRMLRGYFDFQFEQLQIPFYSVTVDLIRGQQVVRESGDIIQAMLESLNLPGISKPILRDGMALVDGGVLNNLPASVLVDRGADFVLGANVSTGLNEEFGRNRPDMKTAEMSSVGNIETLFRVLEVMGTGTAQAHSAATDILLCPDTSEFSFTDFTQGQALMEVGERCVAESIKQIRESIEDLMRF